MRAGDRVLLSGVVYTSRDAATKRINALLEEGGELTNRVAYEDLVNTEFAKKALER